MSREFRVYQAMWHWGIPPAQQEDASVNLVVKLPYLGTVYGLVTYNYPKGAYELSLGKFTKLEHDQAHFEMMLIYTDKDTARLIRKVIRRHLRIRYIPCLRISNRKEWPLYITEVSPSKKSGNFSL